MQIFLVHADPLLWATTATVVLIAAFLNGVTSFGFNIIAIPILVLFLEPKTAVIFAIVTTLILLVPLFITVYHHVDWKHALLIIGTNLCGIPIGTYIIMMLSQSSLRLLIGAVVIVLSIPLFIGRASPIRHETTGCAVAGFVSGVLNGSTAIGGPPIVMFLLNQRWDIQRFRGTLTVAGLGSMLSILVYFNYTGLLSKELVLMPLVTSPMALIGVFFGHKALAMINPGLFRVIVILLVVTAGLTAVLSELARIL